MMKMQRAYLVLLLLGQVSIAVSQSLLDDLKKVSRNYQSSQSYVIEWTSYMINTPDDKVLFVLKKCDDMFYLNSPGQINCINGDKQLSIIETEKIIIYSNEITQANSVDPIVHISKLLGTTYSDKLIENRNGIRKYRCLDLSGENFPIDVIIDSNKWMVIRVVQYADVDRGNGFVFELKKYSPYCEAGPEIHINTYISFDASKNMVLRPRFKDYNLFTQDNYSRN